VIGRVRTGYASSQAGESGEIGEFGLLYASEEPEPWGFHDAIWRGGSFALYRRPERTRAHLRLDQTLPPGQTLALSLGADDVAFAPADLAGGQPRSATISVATLRASAIEIDGRVSSLAPGVTALHLGDYATPGLLTLRNVGGEPLLVRYLTLAEPAPDALAQEDGDHAGIVARAVADAQGSSVTARIETLLPDSGPLVVSLDVWDTDVGVQYGWYGATLSPRQDAQELVLTLNLQTGAASAVDSGGAQLPIGVHFGGLRPGTYTGRFYVGAEALPLLPPADIFQFRVERDGSVRVEWVDDTSLLAASVERPATRADAWVADDVRLQGYTLLTEAPAPGGEVLVALWWQCVREALDERSVLVHVLDSRGERVAQGDGPPATGILPTTQWREGDLVLDVRRVRLPEGLPPGPYTLAVGMYRWPSLERLPLTVASGRASDDVIRIPIQVDQER
jgi:hypothetical protein